MTYIGGSAFASADALTRLVIPDSVTLIGPNAFLTSNLNSLTFVGDTSTAPKLGDSTFGSTSVSYVQGDAWKTYAEANYIDSFKSPTN